MTNLDPSGFNDIALLRAEHIRDVTKFRVRVMSNAKPATEGVQFGEHEWPRFGARLTTGVAETKESVGSDVGFGCDDVHALHSQNIFPTMLGREFFSLKSLWW
jgi:hypothetical protein